MVKINNQVSPGSIGRPGGRPASRKAENTSEGVPGSGDQDKLTANEQAVSVARLAARNVSDVDEAKVAELRDALARGEYKADMRVVAERVINEAMQFGKT